MIARWGQAAAASAVAARHLEQLRRRWQVTVYGMLDCRSEAEYVAARVAFENAVRRAQAHNRAAEHRGLLSAEVIEALEAGVR